MLALQNPSFIKAKLHYSPVKFRFRYNLGPNIWLFYFFYKSRGREAGRVMHRNNFSTIWPDRIDLHGYIQSGFPVLFPRLRADIYLRQAAKRRPVDPDRSGDRRFVPRDSALRLSGQASKRDRRLLPANGEHDDADFTPDYRMPDDVDPLPEPLYRWARC